jgi:serine/threonine protein kinase
VAEFVEGGSLLDAIRTRRIYVGNDETIVSRILTIAFGAASGMAHAHEAGLIHCDLKPGNILLTADETPKITDFGLAQLLPTDGGRIRSLGFTPAFASPEQVARTRVDRSTDVWSWAASVVQMLIGNVPWRSGEEVPAYLEEFRRRGGKPIGLPSIPISLIGILARCFQPPRDRPSFLSLAAELRALHESLFNDSLPLGSPDVELVAADSLNNRGVSLLDLGRIREGDELLQQALRADPYHPEAHYNRNALSVNSARRENPAQLEAFRRAAESSESSYAHLLLARLLMAIGKKRIAKFHFDLARRLDPAAADSGRHPPKCFRHIPYRLARPLTGRQFWMDLVRFQRLTEKATRALDDGRLDDGESYIRLAADIDAFRFHSVLRSLRARLQSSRLG